MNEKELLEACKLAQVRIGLLEGFESDTYQMLNNVILKTENKCCYHGCNEPLGFLGIYLCKYHGEVATDKDCDKIEERLKIKV